MLGAGLCAVVSFWAFAQDEETLHEKLVQERKDRFAQIRRNPILKHELLESAQELPRNFKYAALFDKKTDVLLVGEEHTDPIPARDVNLMIESLATSKMGLTHIASEFLLSSEQPVLDKFAKGEISYDQLKKSCKLKNRVYVAVVAKRHHIQVVGLDLPKAQENSYWAMTAEGLTARNKAWTKRILQIKQQNPKAKILLHGGSFHTQLTSKYYPTMPQLLQEAGLHVKVVEFTSARDSLWRPLGVDRGYDLLFTVPEKLRQYVNADYVIHTSREDYSAQAKAEIEVAVSTVSRGAGEQYWRNDSISDACFLDPQNPICRAQINGARLPKKKK